jgi:sensor histidine kinase YesM
MKKAIDIKLLRFYLWVGLAYYCLGVFTNLHAYPGRVAAALLNNLWGIIYLIPVNFIFLEYVVPFVLRKKRFILYNILWGFVFLFLFMMLWSYGSYVWRLFGININIYTALKDFKEVDKALESQMAYSTGSIFLFGIARHVYNYMQLKQAEQQLRIEKQEAELNYLRSQTNPHFLFNTLNNIYSLARDKSELAPESIVRLSKILRFMLYETSGNYISIEQELKIITDYIELEKLRYDETLRINFNYDIEDMKQSVPPLLLLPLVENAFKHGVSETRDQPFVDIHLSVKNRQLSLVVKNSSETISSQTEVKENIGLSNLRRQLQLLFKEYDLSLQQGNHIFTAQLKINLATHV